MLERYFVSLILAFLISLIWMIFGRHTYQYNKRFPEIFGMNIFPLIAWTIGLFILSMMYYFMESFFSKTMTIILLIPIYWILLIFSECFGYNFFNIHNEKMAGYKTLPIIGCMHSPTWMKIVYFSMDPIMLACLLLVDA